MPSRAISSLQCFLCERDLLVYIEGKAFVTTYVHSQTLMPAQGPEMLRSELGNISAEMIQGSPLAPNDHVAPKIMIAAVAALPPAMVLALCVASVVGFARAM